MPDWNIEKSELKTRRFVAFAGAVFLAFIFMELILLRVSEGRPFMVIVLLLGTVVLGTYAFTSFTTDELYDIWRVSGLTLVVLFGILVLVYAALGIQSGNNLRGPLHRTGLSLISVAILVFVTSTLPLAIGMFDRWKSDPPEGLQF